MDGMRGTTYCGCGYGGAEGTGAHTPGLPFALAHTMCWAEICPVFRSSFARKKMLTLHTHEPESAQLSSC